MKYNALKRTACSLLAIVMIVTTLFVMDPSGLFPTADASISAQSGSAPDVYIVVPETLYMTPSLTTTQTVQFYINNTVSGTTITPDEERTATSGKIWFNVSGGTVTDLQYTIPGTNKLNVPMSAGSGAETLSDVTLDVGMTASTVRALEWIFTFLLDGRPAEYHAFSIAYAPYYTPVGAAVNAKHGNAALQSQGIAWISGVHSYTNSEPSPVAGDKDNWIADDYRARTAWDGEWNRPLVPMISDVPAPTNNDENITDWLSQSASGACPDATFTLYDVDKAAGGLGNKSIDVSTQSHIANLAVDISRNRNFNTIPNLTTGFFVSDLKRDNKWMGSYGGYIANYEGNTPGIDFWFSLNHYYDGCGSFAATEGVDTAFFGGNPDTDNGTRNFTTDAIPYNGLWNRATPTEAGTTMQYIHAATCCEYGNNWIYMNMYLLINVTAVDKTALRNKIFLKQYQANAKMTDDYAAVREKLEAAYLALGDPSASQAAIDSAMVGLDAVDQSMQHSETIYAQHVNQLTGEAFPEADTEHLTTRRSDSSVCVDPNFYTGYSFTGMRRSFGFSTAYGLFDANAWMQSDCSANGSGVSAVEYDAPSRTITVYNADTQSNTAYPVGNVLNSNYYCIAVDPSETYTIDFDYASAARGKVGVICYDQSGSYIGSTWLFDSIKATGSEASFRHQTEIFCPESSPYLYGIAHRFDVHYIVLTFGISAEESQGAAAAVFTNISVTPSNVLFDFAQWNNRTSSLRSSTNASGIDGKSYDSSTKTLTLVSIRPDSNTSYTTGNVLTACEVSGTQYYPWNYIHVESSATYTVEGEYAGTGNGQILIAHYNANGDFTGLTRLTSSVADGGILASTGDAANFDPFYATFTVKNDDAYIALCFGGYNNPYATAYSTLTNAFRNVQMHTFSSADKVYTLYYRPNTYTVSFDANGGIGTMADQDFAYNVPQNLTANTFTRPGYAFTGWATSAGGEKAYDDGAVVNNLTAVADVCVVLYACWTAESYTIGYDAAGGTITGDCVTSYDADTVFTLPNAVRDGYTLTGWRANDSGNWGPITYKPDVSLTGLYGNVTLTAVWKNNTYAVSFNPNGGEGPAMQNQSFVYGTAQQLSANAYSRTGYTFRGWALTESAEEPLYQDKQSVQDLTIEPNVTVTLYAVWGERVYTIVYSTDGGEIRDTEYTTEFTINGQINLPLTVEKTSYTFTGWKAAAAVGSWNTDTLYTGTLNSGMTGNVTLQAQWSMKGYTILYTLDGGSIVGTKYTTAYDIGTTITLPQARKTGYTFDGWQADGTGNWRDDIVYQPGSVSAGRYGDVTLTALWTGVQYYVHFNGNGSTGGMMYNQSFTYGEDGTLNLNEYVRGGYTFKGWALSDTASAATYEDGGTVLNLSNTAGSIVTLYAVWEKISYTITYDPLDGTLIAPYTTTYTITDTVTLPAAERRGYTLDGWSPIQNSGSWNTWETYTGSINLGCYGDVTLAAKWSKATYTITYDPVEGTMSGSYTREYDIDTQIVLPAVTRTGYTFGGWLSSAEWNNVVVTDTAPADAAGNVTLTAIWVRNSYSVRFHANGGTGTMEDQTFRFDEAQTLTPNAFERLGYSFAGWATSESGAVVYSNSTEVYNLTLVNGAVVHMYAVWNALNFTIRYDLNGASGNLNGSTVVMDSSTTLRNYPTVETEMGGSLYTFAGWAYTDADADNGIVAYANRGAFILNSDVLSMADVNWESARPVITLYAVWIAADIQLVVPEGKTTVIDPERKYIYGLKTGITRAELENEYLGVIGNGRVEISAGAVGTGTIVQLIANSTNAVLETYEIVIFGDTNGDGLINSTDITNIRLMNAGLIEVNWGEARTFAADLNADGNVNSTDVTDVRLLNANLLQYDQAARCMIEKD